MKKQKSYFRYYHTIVTLNSQNQFFNQKYFWNTAQLIYQFKTNNPSIFKARYIF